MEVALEARREDVRREGDSFEIITDPNDFETVADALKAAKIETDVAEITRIPSNTVDIDVDTGRKVLKLVEQLDDHDDVQSVSANFNLPDEAMAEIGGE
ncbi:MAG: YebC/PmpR family DNA-binding transcriptional regulator [Pirellulales bacterium]